MNKKDVTNLCNSILTPVNAKLDNLLESLALKSDIDGLIKSIEHKFLKELEEKDKQISALQDDVADLNNKNLDMTTKLQQQDTRISNLEHKLDDANLGERNAVVTELPVKESADYLLLGDSIVKHLDTDRMFVGSKSVLSCNPGADVNAVRDVFDSDEQINKHDFKNIILHVGSNNAPRDNPHKVSSQIIKLVNHIKSKSPKSNVYVSAVLPKVGLSFFPGLHAINCHLQSASQMLDFEFIRQPGFCHERGLVLDMFAMQEKVKVHLSRKGNAQLAHNILSHIKNA